MATESSFVQPAIPMFDGHYDHWSMLMENFLRSKQYWSLVETGIPAAVEGVDPTDAQKKTIEDQKLLKAKNYLFQAIDCSILKTILKKETTNDIWDSLKQKYQGTARVKCAQLQALRKEFEVLHMKVGESVNDYFAQTLTIANKMRVHGEIMGDVGVIEKILRSMTPKYDYVVCYIEEFNNLDALSIDEMQSSLLVHEQWMSGHTVDEQALKWECTKKDKDGKVNYADASEEMLLMAYVDVQETGSDELWFIDSGCSNHMSGKNELFSEFDGSFREYVKMGNNSSLDVLGKVNIRMLG
ncbi:uncharacterized protein [Malus domestica]|uniref:uncharacterized protein n=1 Tax=Malus domestica TaxID=3750 RepID=UPI00397577EB